jgi:hypothetical protein
MEAKPMSKRNIYWIIGGVLIVVLLAGGAFMAMRLLNARAQGPLGMGGGGGMLQFNSGGKSQSVMIKQIPAPELPKQAADLRGQVASVQNNSIYVAQQDKIRVAVINGQVQQQPTPSGPSTEVVVSKETKIYRDVTMDDMAKPAPGASGSTMQVQQKVEAADISAITPNSFVQVWGQRRGDRLNAEVIVVMGIAVINKPGGK